MEEKREIHEAILALIYRLRIAHNLFMRRSAFFKAVSVVVLTAVVMMFSGLSGPAFAALFGTAEKSCCDECNNGGNGNPVNCSTPGCPLFLCLAITLAAPFTPSIPTEGVYAPQTVEALPVKSPVKSIFHPPTIS